MLQKTDPIRWFWFASLGIDSAFTGFGLGKFQKNVLTNPLATRGVEPCTTNPSIDNRGRGAFRQFRGFGWSAAWPDGVVQSSGFRGFLDLCFATERASTLYASSDSGKFPLAQRLIDARNPMCGAEEGQVESNRSGWHAEDEGWTG